MADQSRHALADIRSALSVPDDTALYAYRAMESMRWWFQRRVDPPTDEWSEGWRGLAEAMELDDSAHRTFDELRAQRRTRGHGDLQPISEGERIEFITIAGKAVRCVVERVAV